MPEIPFRIACDGIPYRKGVVEIASVHPRCVNLETWNVSAELHGSLSELAEIPEDAIVANTEIELTVTQARELAAALNRAADVAERHSSEQRPT